MSKLEELLHIKDEIEKDLAKEEQAKRKVVQEKQRAELIAKMEAERANMDGIILGVANELLSRLEKDNGTFWYQPENTKYFLITLVKNLSLGNPDPQKIINELSSIHRALEAEKKES